MEEALASTLANRAMRPARNISGVFLAVYSSPNSPLQNSSCSVLYIPILNSSLSTFMTSSLSMNSFTSTNVYPRQWSPFFQIHSGPATNHFIQILWGQTICRADRPDVFMGQRLAFLYILNNEKRPSVGFISPLLFSNFVTDLSQDFFRFTDSIDHNPEL